MALLPGPLRLGVFVPVWALSRGQIDPFKNYSYSIGLAAKINILKKKVHKNVDINVQRM